MPAAAAEAAGAHGFVEAYEAGVEAGVEATLGFLGEALRVG
jgi:hypothetical protein